MGKYFPKDPSVGAQAEGDNKNLKTESMIGGAGDPLKNHRHSFLGRGLAMARARVRQ